MKLLKASRSAAAPQEESFLNNAAELAALQAEVDALRSSQAVIEFEPDGTIVDANDNFLQAMGYARHEVVGNHHRMFVDQEYAASTEYGQFWDKLRRGEHHAGTYRRVANGGQTIWIQASYNPVADPSGRITRVVKYASDITELKAEQANSSRLLCMIDSMPLAIMYVDRDLVIQYANPASIELLEKVQHALPITP
ncbi:MAG: PAS domain S-box protein, partial [Planctomycetota bacterium]